MMESNAHDTERKEVFYLQKISFNIHYNIAFGDNWTSQFDDDYWEFIDLKQSNQLKQNMCMFLKCYKHCE